MFNDDDYLEKRKFVCSCGKSATYYIYQRNDPYFVSCDCGKNFQFDWGTDKFLNETPKEFNLMEDDDDSTDRIVFDGGCTD